MYGHDQGGTRYSTLTKIRADNVTKLERVWTFHMSGEGEATTPVRLVGEATPIVVGGMMYLTTPYIEWSPLSPRRES
jgi:quinoprotein glucose dehydrogenase